MSFSSRRRPLVAATAIFLAAISAPAAAQSVWTGAIDNNWLRAGNWRDGTVPTASEEEILIEGEGAAITDASVDVSNSHIRVGVTSGGVLRMREGAILTSSGSTLGDAAEAFGSVTLENGSVWNADGFLTVGNWGIGALDITSGSQVNGYAGAIAVEAGSSASVIVSGAGSVWFNETVINVGLGGTGGLHIDDGGLVDTFQGLTVGNDVGSQGMVDVSGVDANGKSSELRTEALVIGVMGTGGVRIGEGAKLTTRDTIIGVLTESVVAFAPQADELHGTGLLTIEGDGTRWENGNNLFVGDYGSGVLVVKNQAEAYIAGGWVGKEATGQGSIEVDNAYLGFDTLKVGSAGQGMYALRNGADSSGSFLLLGELAGSDGQAHIDGSGTVQDLGELVVGGVGKGLLTITNGGTVSTAYGVWVGKEAGGEGALHVNGAGSSFTGLDILIGTAGKGVLEITDGSVVDSVYAHIGTSAGGDGTARVSGAGSVWKIADLAYVGDAGTGSVVVEDGGSLVVGSSVHLGDDVDSSGAISVAGSGSTFSASGMYVGGRGTGKLDVTDGTVEVSDFISIGDTPSASGSVSVLGADAELKTPVLTVGAYGSGELSVDAGKVEVTGGDLTIGQYGTGKMRVVNGGTVDSQGDNTYIGQAESARGDLLVSGAGSSLSAQTLFVGGEGQGTLTIAAGADVDSGDSLIGWLPGSVGRATVTGAGSRWNNSGFLDIGLNGESSLRVDDGGKVTSVGADIGYYAAGTVELVGAGTSWANTDGRMIIGASSNAKLTIAAGAALDNAADAVLASNAGASATVLVTGAGSAWKNADDLMIGSVGVAKVGIADDGLLTSKNAAIGVWDGSVGDVTVTGVNSLWRVDGDLDFGAEGGAGVLTLSDGGTAQVSGMVNIAVATGSTGTLNIGGAAGESAISAGTLEAGQVVFGEGTGTVNFNHTGNRDGSAVVFGAAISGAGAVNQLGSGTTVLSAQNTYTGATTVSAGTLQVDGSIAGSVLTVNTGGRLSGTGTVGSTTLHGTLAPGHSIGTLNVQGDLLQASGSTYEAELGADGRSDHVVVSGQATLQSQANLRLDGEVSYVPGTRYTLLTAQGGVNGQFALANQGQLSTFLQAQASYDATHAYIDIAQSRSFAAVGQTPNQIATGQGLQAAGRGAVFDKVLLLQDEAQARNALDQLSGEGYASARTGLIEQSRDLRQAAAERRGQAGGLWVNALDGGGRLRGDGNAATFTHNRHGVLLGADWTLGDHAYLGVLGGMSRGDFDGQERGTQLDVDSRHAGLYGGWSNETFGLQAGVGYSRHQIDGERKVGFTGFQDRLQADYDARTVQGYVRGEAALSQHIGGYAEVSRIQAKSEAFQERGGAAALRVDEADTQATYATVGVSLDLPSASGWTLGGRLGWRQRLSGDEAASSTQHIGNGTGFTVWAPVQEKGAFVGEVGASKALGERSRLRLDYAGSAGGGAADHRIEATYSLRF